jgi:hypothetical protein
MAAHACLEVGYRALQHGLEYLFSHVEATIVSGVIV